MKTLVVEDSRLARDGLVRMLSKYSDLQLVGAAEDAEVARTMIYEYRPELLFLDIHMPGETGFELLESLDYEPKIIFTTAYSEYAIKSFDFQTVDYLLKPVSEERLALAIEKLTQAQDTSAKSGPALSEPALTMDSRIFVKDGDRCHLVELASIDYIESCKNYVRLFFDGEKAFVKKSLNQVEQRLPGIRFFRANRQYLINLHAIRAIEEAVQDGYEVTMNDGKVIEMSRRNAARLKEVLSL